ncbi:MAG: hypothetical protein LBU00_03065, partial [Treponema sp.]|nr:hypothetical protein [Treponema sp.]
MSISQRTDWLPIPQGTAYWQWPMTGFHYVPLGKPTGISPYPALTELTTLKRTAATALETAKNETTRTPVTTAQCKEAFDALTACMRDFKRRYSLSPPLLDSDYISLGLTPRGPLSAP